MKMNHKKKNKIQIALLKNKVIKLRANYQLPYYLTHLILNLDGEESISYVKYLMEMSEHLLRVKNYYKKFKKLDVEATKSIKDGLLKMGFDLDHNA